ncbi:unnamed protein product [Litomosoides sigmodontis]|uniref:SRCR domain-containing protein n=1 Tax=Litomosoides sigmodontis TaxID=42156 RepID=A0A3P6TP05_LITSI|nr:unnamed protein product [Litomosoides sigmodontis]
MFKLRKAFLAIPMIALAIGQNPLILSVTCRNYGKVLLRGQLDDCVPENFRCFLRNPIVVNLTELVCIMDNENAASKPPLVSCIVTGNVPLMKEKCSEEGDCHSVTVSCPIAKQLDNDIISDNNVIEQEQNIIAEKALPHPPLLSVPAPEDSSRSCFFFSDNKTTGIDESSRSNGGGGDGGGGGGVGGGGVGGGSGGGGSGGGGGGGGGGTGGNWKSCMPIDAHECLIIWETDRQRCHDSNCLSIHLNCPVLDEYEMVLPIQKSRTGALGLVLSLAFFTGVIAACIGSYFQQVCLKTTNIGNDENDDIKYCGNSIYPSSYTYNK